RAATWDLDNSRNYSGSIGYPLRAVNPGDRHDFSAARGASPTRGEAARACTRRRTETFRTPWVGCRSPAQPAPTDSWSPLAVRTPDGAPAGDPAVPQRPAAARTGRRGVGAPAGEPVRPGRYPPLGHRRLK